MSCCNRPSCSRQKTDSPAEPLLDTAIGFEQIVNLMEIARAGLHAGAQLQKVVTQNSAVKALAKKIADLAIENESLKKVVNVFTPVRVNVGVTDAKLAFGTEAEYTLIVPIRSQVERDTLRHQFLQAAAALAVSPDKADTQQQLLPFDN